VWGCSVLRLLLELLLVALSLLLVLLELLLVALSLLLVLLELLLVAPGSSFSIRAVGGELRAVAVHCSDLSLNLCMSTSALCFFLVEDS